MKNITLLIFISFLSFYSYCQNANPKKKFFNFDRIFRNYKPDKGNVTTPYKLKASHNLEFNIGVITSKPNDYAFMADLTLLAGYKYYYPLKKRYLFASTSHGLGTGFDSIDKKFSYLSFYEIGLMLNNSTSKVTNDYGRYGFYLAIGISNYNHYARNPIYFINNANKIDQLDKLNATFLSLRLDALITSCQFFYNLKQETRIYSKFGFGVSIFLPIELFKK